MGLNRLHQFDKVEIVQISTSENSYDVLEEMKQYVEEIIDSLLPYRMLRLCGKDLGLAAITCDFEVYLEARKWLKLFGFKF